MNKKSEILSLEILRLGLGSGTHELWDPELVSLVPELSYLMATVVLRRAISASSQNC